jgi:hypothetical protein
MKQQTRDNLIYLSVGIGLAALVTFDAFYSASHNRKMWMPSKFAFRAVTAPSLLAYFVIREMLRRKATLAQTLASVLFATLLQLGIMFSLREIIDQLPGLLYSAVAVVEMFFVWQLSVQSTFYLFGVRRP